VYVYVNVNGNERALRQQSGDGAGDLFCAHATDHANLPFPASCAANHYGLKHGGSCANVQICLREGATDAAVVLILSKRFCGILQ